MKEQITRGKKPNLAKSCLEVWVLPGVLKIHLQQCFDDIEGSYGRNIKHGVWRFRRLGVESVMHRMKQAHIDFPIGAWCVHNGVLTIMSITIIAALALAPTLCDLHAVELWSGVGAIVAAAEKHNYNTTMFDLVSLLTSGRRSRPGRHTRSW